MMIPAYVENIIKRLKSNGFEAYIVGGSVRDIILGLTPSDYDITTSAAPNEIIEIFPKTIPTGIKHGTVTVVENGKQCEITTFRLDGEYLDHRHPNSVEFSTDIIEDLSRRDFTINAMAMDLEGNIVDPFHGEEDLKNKIIKCVGDPQKRFDEDALRMLRAYRFASKLSFKIEDNTLNAIKANYELVNNVSSERIRDEIEKILISNNPQVICDVINVGLLDKYLSQVDILKEMTQLSKLKNESITRWSLFAYVLLTKNLISSIKDFLQQLRLDNKTIEISENTYRAVEEFNVSNDENCDVIIKKLLRQYGIEATSIALEYLDNCYNSNNLQILNNVLSSNEAYAVSMLDIDGNEIGKLGYKGKEIGQILEKLLDYVIRNPENNSKDKLIKIIEEEF